MKPGSREVEKSGTDNILSADFVASHRQLNVFQKAYDVALEVHKASLNFPKTEQYALAEPLRRSTKSICANIAEGFARQRDSRLEWRQFLMIALGSCEESSMWLDFCRDLNYITPEQTLSWQNEYDAVIKMLHKLRGAR